MSHLPSRDVIMSAVMSVQDKKLDVQIETSFDQFMKWLQDEKQTLSLDMGNIKLTYNSVSVFK